ncbi:MAG TPA: histidine phosphatase family protein [Jatrophihabitans sp.]
MRRAHFFTHPEVVIDPEVPVPEWELSELGQGRAEHLAARLSGIGSLWASPEVKAAQTSRIIGAGVGLEAITVDGLAEMDRSSTGYLPEPEFWATYQEFLAMPSQSSRGWETAVAAQRRIVAAVDGVLASHTGSDTDVAVVSHGGVGALLLCQLLGTPIQRLVDQPRQGSHFSFDADSREVLSGWQVYEDITQPTEVS